MTSPKESAHRLVEAFNAHDLERHVGQQAADIEWVMPGGTLTGPQEVAGFLQGFWGAFPDLQVTPEQEVIEGAVVVTEGRIGGTHRGALRTPQGEIPATGNSVTVRYASVQRWEGGRIVSEHLYFDQLELLAQLDALPVGAH